MALGCNPPCVERSFLALLSVSSVSSLHRRRCWLLGPCSYHSAVFSASQLLGGCSPHLLVALWWLSQSLPPPPLLYHLSNVIYTFYLSPFVTWPGRLFIEILMSTYETFSLKTFNFDWKALNEYRNIGKYKSKQKWQPSSFQKTRTNHNYLHHFTQKSPTWCSEQSRTLSTSVWLRPVRLCSPTFWLWCLQTVKKTTTCKCNINNGIYPLTRFSVEYDVELQ